MRSTGETSATSTRTSPAEQHEPPDARAARAVLAAHRAPARDVDVRVDGDGQEHRGRDGPGRVDGYRAANLSQLVAQSVAHRVLFRRRARRATARPMPAPRRARRPRSRRRACLALPRAAWRAGAVGAVRGVPARRCRGSAARVCRRCALPQHGGRACPAAGAAFATAWAPVAYEGTRGRARARAEVPRRARRSPSCWPRRWRRTRRRGRSARPPRSCPRRRRAGRARRRGFDPAALLAAGLARRLAAAGRRLPRALWEGGAAARRPAVRAPRARPHRRPRARAAAPVRPARRRRAHHRRDAGGVRARRCAAAGADDRPRRSPTPARCELRSDQHPSTYLHVRVGVKHSVGPIHRFRRSPRADRGQGPPRHGHRRASRAGRAKVGEGRPSR